MRIKHVNEGICHLESLLFYLTDSWRTSERRGAHGVSLNERLQVVTRSRPLGFVQSNSLKQPSKTIKLEKYPESCAASAANQSEGRQGF